MPHTDVKRGGDTSRRQPAQSFPRLAAQEIPEHFPKAEAPKYTDGKVTARQDQPGKRRVDRVQIRHAIEGSEIRNRSIEMSLNAGEIFNSQYRRFHAAGACNADHLR